MKKKKLKGIGHTVAAISLSRLTGSAADTVSKEDDLWLDLDAYSIQRSKYETTHKADAAIAEEAAKKKKESDAMEADESRAVAPTRLAPLRAPRAHAHPWRAPRKAPLRAPLRAPRRTMTRTRRTKTRRA